MAHPAFEFIHAPRPDAGVIGQHLLLGQRIRQQRMLIGGGQVFLALACTRHVHPPVHLLALRRGEQLRHADLQPHGQLLERLIGGRHLPVLDLGQGRARQPRLFRGLFQRPVARLAQLAHPHAQVQRLRAFLRPALAGDPDQVLGVRMFHGPQV